jgi:hypothetical protein
VDFARQAQFRRTAVLHDVPMTMADPPLGAAVPIGSVPAMPPGRLRVVALVALSLAAAGVLVIVASVFPGTGPALTRLWPWLFGAIFPIFAIALVVELATGPRRAPRHWWGNSGNDLLRAVFRWLPPRAGLALKIVLALGVVNFVIFMATMPGQPVTENGRYYANNHGSLTELTAQQFDSAERAEARGFTGHVVMFDSICAALLVANSRRRWHERAAGTR